MSTHYRAYKADTHAIDTMLFEYYYEAQERCYQLENQFGGTWLIEDVEDQNSNRQTSSYNSSENSLNTLWIWLIILYILFAMGD